VEIHPPHGAAHTWKDFLIQLGTITAGVLIALSFEGARESIHDRALVREARENIHREIADNKRELDGEIASLPGRAKRLDAALQFANRRLKNQPREVQQLELRLEFPTLSAASWQTAERTGALAHMDYADVQKYAALYAFQELLTTQHRRALDSLSVAIGIITSTEDDDPTRASAADIGRFREQIIALRSILYVEEQMAQTASARYKKALE
jgi:hypothetical protein